MNNNSVEDLMNKTLEKIQSIMDVTTVVGKPIYLENEVVIIPITKASIGIVLGGGDIKINDRRAEYPFAGGSGAGINITPMGFLVCSKDKYEILYSENSANTSEIISFITGLIKSYSSEEKE